MLKIHNNKTRGGALLVLLLSLFLTWLGIAPVTARAEEQVEEQPTQVQEVIDNTMFITYVKGQDASYGTNLFACHFIPEEVYDASLTYGVIICPARYLDQYIKEGDYLREFTEQSVNIMNLIPTGSIKTSKGRMFKCGVIGIPDEATDMEMAFIFYASDAEENVAYAEPQIASYDSAHAKIYSNTELAKMVEQRLEMNNSFQSIVAKLNELVDSFWLYIVMACGAIVVVWGVYIGIRVAVAKRKDENVMARDMVKQLVIGIGVMFVLAMALPLLIKGLAAWIG